MKKLKAKIKTYFESKIQLPPEIKTDKTFGNQNFGLKEKLFIAFPTIMENFCKMK